MMTRRIVLISLSSAALLTFTGCTSIAEIPGTGDPTGDGVVSDVAAKATNVAAEIGGATGFGGTLMDGYLDHMPPHMGFSSPGDLARADGSLTIRLYNDSKEHCEFHLAYFASHLGLEDQMLDVPVAAGENVAVNIPCSEIVGVGSVGTPGEIGCHLVGGEAVLNTMAVPGFFGQDYACAGTYEISLTPDVDDLDGDGDTEELIIVSDGMRFHLMDGEPHGHMHGHGPGAMGPHMGWTSRSNSDNRRQDPGQET
ncbi:MAG: hypothetical protein JSV19_02085 [Phycisphaerales bacterium]|nr:MAG: hypothetical protein JSV19_02085 [Phycisphaerales bacterium]